MKLITMMATTVGNHIFMDLGDKREEMSEEFIVKNNA